MCICSTYPSSQFEIISKPPTQSLDIVDSACKLTLSHLSDEFNSIYK